MYTKSYTNRTYRLLKDSILVEIYSTPVKHGSLILPTQRKTQQARVFQVSSDLADEISPGDDLIFNPFKGTEIDQKYLLLRKGDILARINR
jgi:co-chaperonin GroES (HSP10)